MTNLKTDYNTHHNENGELFDIKRTIYVIFRFWYYILICAVAGLTVAYVYNLLNITKYQVESKIIVPKNVNEIDFQGIFNIQNGKTTSSSVTNEIAVLKSLKLNQEVADNLNWRIFWYQKDHWVWKGIYNQSPFIVLENGINNNLENVDIYISPINSNSYNLKIKGRSIGRPSPIPEDISVNLTYGEVFKNKYFNFTLLQKQDSDLTPGQEYYFIFRNRDKVALNYLANLTVKEMEEGSEVIHLKLISHDKDRSIDYLNKLVEVYIKMKLEQKTESQKKSIEFIQNQINGISDSLLVSQTNFTDFRSKNKLYNLSQQGSIVLNSINNLEIDRNMYQMQLEYFQNMLKYISNDTDISKIISPSVVGITDQSFISLVQKLIDSYRRREILAYSAKNDNPTLVLLNQEIVQLNRLLSENLNNLITNAKNNLEILNKRLTQVNSELNRLPEKEQKLVNIQREYELTNEIYTFLLQRKAETELAMASTTIDIKVVDIASELNIVSTGKSPFSIYMLGLIIGAMIPIFFIILSDITDNKVKSKLDIQKISTIPILGSIVHSKNNNYLSVQNEPASLIAESFRTIRTNIGYFLNNPEDKVIGINSATSGEGKTFSAVNLATVFAMNEKKTLLVGCDLRRPKLGRLFNIQSIHGLTSVLINSKSISEVIHNCKIDNLFILPAGQTPPNPLELIEKSKFKEFINWARENFDYIILDNAPCYLVSDGIVTSRYCDMNIFVVRAGFTQTGMVENINAIAASSNLKNPCFIINDQTLTDYGYSYKLNYKYDYYTNYSYSSKKNRPNKIASV